LTRLITNRHYPGLADRVLVAGMAVFASEDTKEGPRPFAGKRLPQFRDR